MQMRGARVKEQLLRNIFCANVIRRINRLDMLANRVSFVKGDLQIILWIENQSRNMQLKNFLQLFHLLQIGHAKFKTLSNMIHVMQWSVRRNCII